MSSLTQSLRDLKQLEGQALLSFDTLCRDFVVLQTDKAANTLRVQEVTTTIGGQGDTNGDVCACWDLN